jgi:hypothetical protein
MPSSGQMRLIQNDKTAKNQEGSINSALGEEVNSKASSIKEVKCKTKKKY